MSLNKIIRNFYILLSGNRFAQRMLEKKIKRLLLLTGVGYGGSVKDSGEEAAFKKLKCLKRDDYCIFDVGANRGEFTKLASSHFDNSRSLSIHCFEPSKAAFEMLSGNVKSDDRVVLNNCALGSKQGEQILYANFPGSGTASLTKRDLDHIGVTMDYSEKVRVDTVDDYCREKGLRSIDLLKIDVEGHELDVLYGAEGLLAENAIKIVTFEFGGTHIDTRVFLRDFFHFFEKHNFDLYRITPSTYLLPLPHYKEIFEQFRTTNFLALHKKVHGQTNI
ncbi:MAG: FkbM family methyltransferase [Planctomycetota bacterium]|jgi:FkbM family methyltransferase